MDKPIQEADALAQRFRNMSDEELFDELRMIVNDARFRTLYDRNLAKAIGAECRKRGMIHADKFIGE